MTELLRHGLPKSDSRGVGVLEAILEMADSSITYRSRYLTSLQTDLVLDLLLVDEANPRSIAFQLARLQRTCGSASRAASLHPASRRRTAGAGAAQQPSNWSTCGNWAAPRTTRAAEARDALLDRLAADLSLLSETISTRAYFSHAAQSRQLAGA